jgi:hypothetical protein
MNQVTTIGLDIAKSHFSSARGRRGGQSVLRHRLSRSRVLEFFGKLPRCLVGLEPHFPPSRSTWAALGGPTLRRSRVPDRSTLPGTRATTFAPDLRPARLAQVSRRSKSGSRRETGHVSDAMPSRYLREGELFLGNAAGVFL